MSPGRSAAESGGREPWPDALSGNPAIAVIERAIARRRLSHSLLLHGDDLDTLVSIAFAIADRLLNESMDPGTGAVVRRTLGNGGFPPRQHPDCFPLRPAGKMRQISADATRELINKIQVSPAVAPHKVAILHEADRMNSAAANIFLKTLEEPPPNTTLLLLTTRPYALIPTIRSRVLHFRFPSSAAPVAADGWESWLADYASWLGRLTGGNAFDRRAVADHVFSIYGLVSRFATVLAGATESVWQRQKAMLPAGLDEDQEVAIETGIANGMRARLFAEIEQATRMFALPRIERDDEATRRAVAGAIDRLEHATGLLRVNLNELAALEDFLLASLRIWTR